MLELKKDSIYILGIRVDIVLITDVVRAIEKWIVDKQCRRYIVLSNANNIVLGVKDPIVREAANNSDLSVADGISLVLTARIYGYPLKKRVYGPDLMLEFLDEAEKKGYSNFFYGSSPENLSSLIKRLKQKFPLLKITGFYSPPFRNKIEEDERVIDLVNNSSTDVLWVGLGGPKQDIWMYYHKDKVRVPVMVGIGAAFDFLAGTKQQAPVWMREYGLEWFFRLITEPKRLWRRYLINNLLFVWYVTVDLLKRHLKMWYNKSYV
jgi:N-acetylglucosaminyldiphosphoundecaprenol N-acetyl-beta-D-mannosaminyltransferase